MMSSDKQKLQAKLQTLDELVSFMGGKPEYHSDVVEVISALGLIKLKMRSEETAIQETEIDSLLKRYSNILRRIKQNRKE